MEKDKSHIHKFDTPIEVEVPLYNYELDRRTGKTMRVQSGTDIIKSFKCKCGKTEAYDLERTKA
jgi:hypothetical protein